MTYFSLVIPSKGFAFLKDESMVYLTQFVVMQSAHIALNLRLEKAGEHSICTVPLPRPQVPRGDGRQPGYVHGEWRQLGYHHRLSGLHGDGLVSRGRGGRRSEGHHLLRAFVC